MAQGQPGQRRSVRPPQAGELPEGFDKAIDDLEATFEVGKGVATRGASGSVLNAIAAVMPELWGGSADLGGSNKTDLKGAATFAPAECATKQWPVCSPYGRQLHFACANSPWYHHQRHPAGSHTRPFGGTFFMFSDYERSAVRLAASCRFRTCMCVPRLRRRRRRWPDPPAGGASGLLPRHPAA